MNVDNTIPTTGATETPVTPRRWWALAAVALGVSLIIMDATIVNVALPTIIEDLHLDATQAEWMNAIYSLVFASLLLTVGRVGDIYGRKRLFLIGMVVFVVASILAGFAGGPQALIGARLLQGVGAAMILPSTLSTLNAVFTGRERAIAFAVWGSTIGGMAAIGPLVGGWLVTDYTWRWAFWLNVPVGLTVIALILFAVPETRDDSSPRTLDLYGVALSTIGLAGIVFALIEGQNYGWWRQADGAISPVPIAMAVGVSFMLRFWVVQKKRMAAGKVVLIDLGLLDVRSFRFGSIAALIVALGEFGLLFTLPLLLQNALGFSALGTGWLIAALAVGTFVISGHDSAAHSAVRRSRRRPGRPRLRGVRRRRARGHALGQHQRLGRRRLAVPLRHRRRHGHGAAHLGHPRRDPRGGVRAGVGAAEHVPPARVGPRGGDPRHPAADLARARDDVQPRGDRNPAGRHDPGHRRGHRLCRVGHPVAAGPARDEGGRRRRRPAMITASKVTTGVAALIIGLGLVATAALPYLPPPAPAPRADPAEPVARGRRHGRRGAATA